MLSHVPQFALGLELYLRLGEQSGDAVVDCIQCFYANAVSYPHVFQCQS